jgi:hypothetical protein
LLRAGLRRGSSCNRECLQELRLRPVVQALSPTCWRFPPSSAPGSVVVSNIPQRGAPIWRFRRPGFLADSLYERDQGWEPCGARNVRQTERLATRRSRPTRRPLQMSLEERLGTLVVSAKPLLVSADNAARRLPQSLALWIVASPLDQRPDGLFYLALRRAPRRRSRPRQTI